MLVIKLSQRITDFENKNVLYSRTVWCSNSIWFPTNLPSVVGGKGVIVLYLNMIRFSSFISANNIQWINVIFFI